MNGPEVIKITLDIKFRTLGLFSASTSETEIVYEGSPREVYKIIIRYINI